MTNRPIATITMENGTELIIDLYPEEAPNTVCSFIYLANQRAYDGHAIQRIVPGYVVDASYNAFGKEICKYLIDNEASAHGGPNRLKMEPGVIAMGGYGEMGIAGGEFFFPLACHEKLEGNYPVFGIIREGLDEVLRWETVPLRKGTYPGDPSVEVNEPLAPLVIVSVRVETFGVRYSLPRKREGDFLPLGWR